MMRSLSGRSEWKAQRPLTHSGASGTNETHLTEIFRSLGAKAQNYEVWDPVSRKKYHFRRRNSNTKPRGFCGIWNKNSTSRWRR